MNEEAIIRQIGNLDAAEVKTALHRVHQMQDHLNAIRSAEVHAQKEWLNSSDLIFPEDFTEEMNKLSVDVQPSEKLLKQLDRIEAALNNQNTKLKKKRGLEHPAHRSTPFLLEQLFNTCVQDRHHLCEAAHTGAEFLHLCT
jgi:hypothetical protein